MARTYWGYTASNGGPRTELEMTEALRTDTRPAAGAAPLWFVRLVQASPLSPVWTAVCIGAGLTLANFAVAGLSAGALPIDALFVSHAGLQPRSSFRNSCL